MVAKPSRYQVDVFDMERFTDKGNLKAVADVKIGKSLKIFGMRVIQQPNQKPWVSPPQRSWKGDGEKMKYSPIIELSGALKEEVDAAVLNAWAGDE
jgi:DNA-binding cell septation regulator SpoVG